MESDKIEKLLEKYLEAETNLAEEQALREYFTQESVATHLEEYRSMFDFFSVAKRESYRKAGPLNPRNVLTYKWLSAAAVVALCFGIYFGKGVQERREAEIAFTETKKALELIGVNLDKGTQKIAYLNEFEAAKRKIFVND